MDNGYGTINVLYSTSPKLRKECINLSNEAHYADLHVLNAFLKGKFSSGIEGALASTLNRDFQLEKTIIDDFFVSFFLCFQHLFEKH